MGEALRLLRIFNGYKSAELADMLEISQSYVSELENNKKQPTIEVLDKYAKVFGMKIFPSPKVVVFETQSSHKG